MDNSKKCSGPGRCAGFTLVELMATLSVAVILVAMATPSFNFLIQNNRLASQTNDFVASLNLARSEAIKRSTSAYICVSSDSVACTGTDWSTGWMIWIDKDGNGTFSAAADETVRVHGALAGSSTLTSTGGSTFSYLPNGMLNGASITFAMSAPGCTGTSLRTVTVHATGRAAVTKSACP